MYWTQQNKDTAKLKLRNYLYITTYLHFYNCLKKEIIKSIYYNYICFWTRVEVFLCQYLGYQHSHWERYSCGVISQNIDYRVF